MLFEFAWEGRIILISCLLLMLIVLVGLRTYALRRFDYKWRSPRGVSSLCVFGVLILGLSYLLTNAWYYHKTISIRKNYTSVTFNIRGSASKELMSRLLKIVLKRKKYAFYARVATVTMLWLAKSSFLAVYIGSRRKTNRKAKAALCATVASVLLSYLGIWVAMSFGVGRQWFLQTSVLSHSYLVSYGLNGDNVMDILLFDTYLDGLFWWEAVVGIVNILTDLLLAITACFIFSSIRSQRHVLRAEFLLIILCLITVSLACARVGILAEIQSEQVHFDDTEKHAGSKNGLAKAALDTANSVRPLRLAATVLTEVEAFVAGAVICIPAIRVLWRQSRTGNQSGYSGDVEAVGMTDEIPLASRSGHDAVIGLVHFEANSSNDPVRPQSRKT